MHVTQYYVSQTSTNVPMLGFCVPMSSWSPRTKVRNEGCQLSWKILELKQAWVMSLREKEMSLGPLTLRRDSSRMFLSVEWKGGGKWRIRLTLSNCSEARDIGRGTLQGLVVSSVLVIVMGAVGAHPDRSLYQRGIFWGGKLYSPSFLCNCIVWLSHVGICSRC